MMLSNYAEPDAYIAPARRFARLTAEIGFVSRRGRRREGSSSISMRFSMTNRRLDVNRIAENEREQQASVVDVDALIT